MSAHWIDIAPTEVIVQGWRNDLRGGGGGTRPWGTLRKRVPKYLKGPKTTYTTIAIAEKQSKRSKKGHFVIYWVPPGPSQEMEIMGLGGAGPSRSPGFSSNVIVLLIPQKHK